MRSGARSGVLGFTSWSRSGSPGLAVFLPKPLNKNQPNSAVMMTKKIFPMRDTSKRGAYANATAGHAPNGLFFDKRTLDHEMPGRGHVAFNAAFFDHHGFEIFQHLGATANHDAVARHIEAREPQIARQLAAAK